MFWTGASSSRTATTGSTGRRCTPSLPDFERDAELEKRVLDEILSPAFSGEQPEGLLRVVRFKTRRWWANRWKHRLVFDEGLAGAFVRSAWAHLKRPRSIAH